MLDNLGSFSVVVRLNIEIEMLISTSFNELPVNDINEDMSIQATGRGADTHVTPALVS